MKHLYLTAVVMVLSSFGSLHAAAAPSSTKNTRELLEDYGKSLVEAWTKYNTEAQKATRQQSIMDSGAAFNKDIAMANPPPNIKLLACFKYYLTSLDKANDLFRTEKMKSERQTYVRACSTFLKRETQKTSDYAEVRTTQDCFKMFVNLLEEACDMFVLEKNKDLRTESITGAQSFFSDLIKNAKVPEGVDHAEQMDQNIKDARQRFPTTTKVMQEKNQAVLTAVENAAKQVKQKSTRK
jgi:hypothetical protein